MKNANKIDRIKRIVMDSFFEISKCTINRSRLAKIGELDRDCDDAILAILEDSVPVAASAMLFNPAKKRYIIEASTNGVRWRRQAEFAHGQESRYASQTFDSQVALREAEGFKEARGDKFPYVRVIIEV